MRNIIAIFQKEMNSYFRSPIAYGLMAFFGLITGWFFYIATAYFMKSSMASMMQRGGPMDVNESVVRPVLMNVSVIGLFIIPMITMRLFAEEKRQGTMELLVTSPISDLEIILGKWFAALGMYCAVLAMPLLSLLVLYGYGKPDWKPMAVGFLGLILQGGALLALGAFLSNTTKNQIVAGVGTFAICLLLWVLDWVSSFESAPWAKVVAYLSVVSHFEPFSKGIVDSKDVIFFLSMIFFGLFLTARSMESLRWRS